jgi:hypothetical protein
MNLTPGSTRNTWVDTAENQYPCGFQPYFDPDLPARFRKCFFQETTLMPQPACLAVAPQRRGRSDGYNPLRHNIIQGALRLKEEVS